MPFRLAAPAADAPMMPLNRRLLVSGCGRSGTKYIAFVLQRMGLDVRHERLGRDGISSWTMAVTTEERFYGPPSSAASFKQVFHQTREPLSVINSCLSFTDRSWDFICENIPCPRAASPDIRAATYWLLWNEKVEKIATWRYRIEDFPGILLEEFFDRLKVSCNRRLINSNSTQFQHSKARSKFSRRRGGFPQSRRQSAEVAQIDVWEVAKPLRGDMGWA